MTCGEWTELMLEADPSELAGRGESPLARHIAGCAACRRKAALLLRSADLLDRSLARDTLRPAAARPGPRRLRRALLVALPLAAAAMLVLILRLRIVPGGRDVAAAVPSGLAAVPVPAVTPPPGSSAAVIQTDNPDIVIVWLY